MRWSPPEQKAQPPSTGEGPLPVRSTQPTSGHWRAWARAANSSSTVCGRKALRTSGRSKATRTVPSATARWYVMSVKSKPGTTAQADSSKISEIMRGASYGRVGSVHLGPRRRFELRAPAASPVPVALRLVGDIDDVGSDVLHHPRSQRGDGPHPACLLGGPLLGCLLVAPRDGQHAEQLQVPEGPPDRRVDEAGVELELVRLDLVQGGRIEDHAPE